MKILIADDDPTKRFLLEELLTDWGYEVISAADGLEAWDILSQEQSPLLAILDWIMPGMDGIDVCRRVKQSKHRSYTYIVLLTSKSEKEDVINGLNMGADDFLVKPVDPRELKSRLAAGVRIIEYEKSLLKKNTQLNHYAVEMERLANERKIFFQAYQNSIQGMIITDPEARAIYANISFEENFGFSESEIKILSLRIRDPGVDIYADHGLPKEDYLQILRNLKSGISTPHAGQWEGVLLNRKKDGSVIWIQAYISSVKDESEKIVGFTIMPVNISERLEKEHAIRLDCYRAIVDVAETRDEETGGHLNRLSEYCRLFGEKIGAAKKYIKDIATFSPFHDIGKVGIPDDILRAPRKLTASEFNTMKTHAELGYKILKNRSTLEMAADIAFSHHERYDGSGYPQGLAGEAIPLCGRITALADVYDALRSQRPYKKPWNHRQAVQYIFDQRGSHFDPMLVDAFHKIENEMDEISRIGAA